MSILNSGRGPFPHLAVVASKYRQLADDLERVARGEHPTEAELRDAPRLTDWSLHLLPLPLPFLSGIVVGHPLIGDGRLCRTSEVMIFDPAAGYARTFSRFYRLGPRRVGSGIDQDG